MGTNIPLQGLQAALVDLAAEAKSRASEFESLRKLAPDFTDKLARAGAFKILVPVEAGGWAPHCRNGWR